MPAGQPPKPRGLRILEGNRGHRPIPETVEPKVVKPRAPSWMGAIAKKEWKRVVAALDSVKLLTELDTAALEVYCVAYGKWREASALATVETVEMNSGKTIAANPYIAIELKYLRELRTVMIEFGMTPSSRSRIGAGAKTEETDPMEALLQQTS